MRITGGDLARRQVDVLANNSYRPTLGLVREAIYSSLGPKIINTRVLDIFAGSGALGLEAWSRGAEYVQWVEKDARAYKLLKKNVTKLCGNTNGQTICLQSDVWRYFNHFRGPAFDIILADPPYSHEAEYNVLEKTLSVLDSGRILAESGVLIFEQSLRSKPIEREGWQLIKDKKYGKSRVLFYTPESQQKENL